MTFTSPSFSKSAIDAVKAHALACYPQECCGLIVDNAYVPSQNQAAKASEEFIIAPADLIAAGEGLQAVMHSHPDGQRRPSAADMQSQIDLGHIFGLITCNAHTCGEPLFWGDFMLEQPLIGRDFVPGVSDCYSLIRAWFWQTRQIRLPEFARDESWWKAGKDLYREGFAKAGFTLIDGAAARPGDVFIGQVRADVPNHGGVLLENGLGLHHLQGRLSRREPLSPWLKSVTHWLRYDGVI